MRSGKNQWAAWAFAFLITFSMLAGFIIVVPEHVSAAPTTTTIYSGWDDRVLWETGSVYETARNDTSANGGSYNASGANSDIIHNSYPAGFIIARDLIWFDLTALPAAGSTVTSATLSLYVEQVACADGAPQTGIDVCPPVMGYSPGRPAIADDYNRANIETPAASRTSFSDLAYNDFTIPIENITLGSWNAFYLRMKGDVDDTAPTSGKSNLVYFWLGGAALQGHRPKLNITYDDSYAIDTFHSGSDDRGLLIQNGSTFADARDRTTGTVMDWANNANGLHNSKSGADAYYIYRSVINFDLSAIPAGSTINSATLSIYVTTVLFTDGAPQTGLRVCTPISTYPSRPAVAADFDRTRIDIPVASTNTFTENAYNDLTIPITNIEPDEWNAFYLRMKGDVEDTAPTGTASWNSIGMYLGTATDIANRPKLVVNYTLPLGGPATWAPTLNSITPYGSSNSSYADWVVGDDFDTGLIYNESCEYLLYTNASFLIFGGDNGTEYCDVVNNSVLLVGSYYAHVEATSDSGTLALWTNWTFDVWATPVLWNATFISSPALVGTTGILYSYFPACNESVTFNLATKPSWAALGPDGYINGTPISPGSYDFELCATSVNGTLDAWQNWTVVVNASAIPIVPSPALNIVQVLNEMIPVFFFICIAFIFMLLMFAFLDRIERHGRKK